MTTRIQESYYDDDGNLHMADALLGEKKDYSIDWSTRLTNEGDVLQTVDWTVPTGMTEIDTDIVDGETVIWLTADVIGTYLISCSVNTTDNGQEQTYMREFYITVL